MVAGNIFPNGSLSHLLADIYALFVTAKYENKNIQNFAFLNNTYDFFHFPTMMLTAYGSEWAGHYLQGSEWPSCLSTYLPGHPVSITQHPFSHIWLYNFIRVFYSSASIQLIEIVYPDGAGQEHTHTSFTSQTHLYLISDTGIFNIFPPSRGKFTVPGPCIEIYNNEHMLRGRWNLLAQNPFLISEPYFLFE